MPAWSAAPVARSMLAALRVDGGATANEWLMAFQAGVLGVPVRRPANVETTAMGAAGLAGLQVGVWDSAERFLESQGEPTVFEPALGDRERDTLLKGWARALDAVRAWSGAGSGR